MFPRDRLVFGTELGTGWFGKVSLKTKTKQNKIDRNIIVDLKTVVFSRYRLVGVMRTSFQTF